MDYRFGHIRACYDPFPPFIARVSTSIDAIAVDWITQKLYWADAEAKQILVLDLITRLGKVIANTGNQTLPRSLVVDPTRRQVLIVYQHEFK